MCWLKFQHVSVGCRHEGLKEYRWKDFQDHIKLNSVPVQWKLEEDWNIQCKILYIYIYIYIYTPGMPTVMWLCQILTIPVFFFFQLPVLIMGLPNGCHIDVNALCVHIAVTRLVRGVAGCSHHQIFLSIHFKNFHSDWSCEYPHICCSSASKVPVHCCTSPTWFKTYPSIKYDCSV
jgi:hypothetical protein